MSLCLVSLSVVVVCLSCCAEPVSGPGSLGQGLREAPPVNVCLPAARGLTPVAYGAIKEQLRKY